MAKHTVTVFDMEEALNNQPIALASEIGLHSKWLQAVLFYDKRTPTLMFKVKYSTDGKGRANCQQVFGVNELERAVEFHNDL